MNKYFSLLLADEQVLFLLLADEQVLFLLLADEQVLFQKETPGKYSLIRLPRTL